MVDQTVELIKIALSISHEMCVLQTFSFVRKYLGFALLESGCSSLKVNILQQAPKTPCHRKSDFYSPSKVFYGLFSGRWVFCIVKTYFFVDLCEKRVITSFPRLCPHKRGFFTPSLRKSSNRLNQLLRYPQKLREKQGDKRAKEHNY